MDGLGALRAIALSLSSQPLHGRKVLEDWASRFTAMDEVETSVIQAVMARQRGEGSEVVALQLEQALDQVLLLPAEKRSWPLEWFLEGARLLLSDPSGIGESGRFGSLVRRAVAHGEVGPPVLRAWRHAGSQAHPSNGELLYAVRLIVEGVSLRHASDAPDQPAATGEVSLPFAVAYEVSVQGKDENEARELATDRARELEELLGGTGMEVTPVAVEALQPGAVRAPYGVMRRSGRIFHQGDGGDSTHGG
jgi:hypothetical protein